MSHQWRYIQAGWLVNADKARLMVQRMKQLKNGNLSILALVEDGMFEDSIKYPVALYAEMLWDCDNTIGNLMKYVALRSYVDFV